MRHEQPTAYELITGRRRWIRQAEPDFLADCGIRAEMPEARIALGIRRILASWTGIEPDQILAEYTISEDLGFDAMDSLKLVDIALEFEAESGITVDEVKAAEINELNAINATVREIIDYFTGDR